MRFCLKWQAVCHDWCSDPSSSAMDIVLFEHPTVGHHRLVKPETKSVLRFLLPTSPTIINLKQNHEQHACDTLHKRCASRRSIGSDIRRACEVGMESPNDRWASFQTMAANYSS